MDSMGVNILYLLESCLVLMVALGWPVLAVIALLRLRKASLPETARAIWAALILLIPLAGALGFLIVKPGEQI